MLNLNGIQNTNLLFKMFKISSEIGYEIQGRGSSILFSLFIPGNWSRAAKNLFLVSYSSITGKERRRRKKKGAIALFFVLCASKYPLKVMCIFGEKGSFF